VFSGNRRIASKAAHEFFKFVEALKKHKDTANFYPSILTQVKRCISEHLEGRRYLSQDSIDDLYQLIGITLAHPTTTSDIALSIIEVRYFTSPYRNTIACIKE